MRFLFTLFFFFGSVIAFAQNIENNKKYRLPRYTIKWSPLHALINHYPTVQLALEQRIGKNISFQYDFGPVVSANRSQSDNTQILRMRGYKAKFEIRHYILNSFDHLWLPYCATEFYYNRINYNKSETAGINCANGQCDYYQFITYGMKYREQGVSLKGGVVFRVYRFSLDFQVGLVARFINYDEVNKPLLMSSNYNGDDNESFAPFGPLFKTIEEDRTIISPTACVRVGYIIR